jgi:hypothetical protein
MREILAQDKSVVYPKDSSVARIPEPQKPCKKCILELHISGHGWGAGVAWSNEDGFDSAFITDDQAAEIRKMMCPGGVVRLWSCSSGTSPDAPQRLQDLASKLGLPVSGVDGLCSAGMNGGRHSGKEIVWRNPKPIVIKK